MPKTLSLSCSLTHSVSIAAYLCLLAFFTALHAFAATPDRPNIVLIPSNDHSVSHVGCYGDVNCLRFNITPHLDAFASEGMRFIRAKRHPAVSVVQRGFHMKHLVALRRLLLFQPALPSFGHDA